MERSSLLEKIGPFAVGVLAIAVVVFLVACPAPRVEQKPLKVAISPYQDLAMIQNIKPLRLEDKYKVKVDLITLPWEEIIPAIGSAGDTVDVGFASYIEFITKSNNLNQNTDDPILFIYPAYVFAGGGFTTLRNDVPIFDKTNISDNELKKKFLSYRIGAQKNSMFDMAIYQLAGSANVDVSTLNLTDIQMADGILALQSKSLDYASAGLTQRNEIEKLGGKVALSFETLGFADITGFICKKSVYEKRKQEIDSLIKMWFESVDYLLADVDGRVNQATMPYLDQNASTKYTIESYKAAIGQEVFPRNISEAQSIIISDTANFSATKIHNTVSEYLVKNGKVSVKPPKPVFINLAP